MVMTQPRVTDTGPHPLVQPITPRHSSFALALGRARRHVSRSANSILVGVALVVSGLALGVLIAPRLQVDPQVASAAGTTTSTSQADRQIVASTISRLQSDETSLKQKVASLQSQVSSAQAEGTQRKTELQTVNTELASQKLASGMLPVQGAGVVASFDDTTDHSMAEGEDPANYILHEYDLRDVINALWIAGAEAVSVNGERIVSNTSLYCVGTTILVNSARLSPPYEVRAVGDPAALSSALRTSTQMEKFNQRARIYDLPVKISESQSVQVPAFSGSFNFKYVQPSGRN